MSSYAVNFVYLLILLYHVHCHLCSRAYDDTTMNVQFKKNCSERSVVNFICLNRKIVTVIVMIIVIRHMRASSIMLLIMWTGGGKDYYLQKKEKISLLARIMFK